jgi:hypothetical protein
MQMGFFSKLKKIVPIVDKGAVIASSVLPGKAGQVAGQVAQGAGVVTSIVQQIQAKSGADLSPEAAQQQATLATAVAVDDHEERVKALEAQLSALRAALGGHSGQAAGSGGAGGAETHPQAGAETHPQAGAETHPQGGQAAS